MRSSYTGLLRFLLRHTHTVKALEGKERKKGDSEKRIRKSREQQQSGGGCPGELAGGAVSRSTRLLGGGRVPNLSLADPNPRQRALSIANLVRFSFFSSLISQCATVASIVRPLLTDGHGVAQRYFPDIVPQIQQCLLLQPLDFPMKRLARLVDYSGVI